MTMYPSVDTSRLIGSEYITSVADAISPYIASITGMPMNM